jgi:hypothetical protein
LKNNRSDIHERRYSAHLSDFIKVGMEINKRLKQILSGAFFVFAMPSGAAADRKFSCKIIRLASCAERLHNAGVSAKFQFGLSAWNIGQNLCALLPKKGNRAMMMPSVKNVV